MMDEYCNILGKYKNDYKSIYKLEETNFGLIYKAEKVDTETEVILKVINKNKIEFDYDFFMEQINREEEITKLCNSENTVNLYRRLDNEDFIIFELEYCEDNLNNYKNNEGDLKDNKIAFKNIVLGMAKALKNLHEKGVMHRDIKPTNIFIKSLNDEDDKKIIKLGDFGCSIYIKDNTSEPMGTILYTAPEIVKNIEYDEKCDLWSLGITLYEIYMGYLPYGPNATTNTVMDVIYDENNFKFNKTEIPNLDILFNRLLVINPKDRMSYDEFFDYVFSNDFMDKKVICVNGNQKYQKIYDIISNQKNIEYFKEDEGVYNYEKECDDPLEEEKKNVKKIITYVEGGHLPDIMNFPNGSTNNEKIYNNIIYYDENTNYLTSINEDSDILERNTPGAFILCTNIESFILIREEILRQVKRDKKTTFNLITTGSRCEKVINFLEENQDFKKCIKNICVYCMNLAKWSSLKTKYNIVYGVYKSIKNVIAFINKFSSKDIKPFPITKLITFHDYLDKYKDRHFKISQYYGDLTPETYKQNIEKIKSLVKSEAAVNELKQKDQNQLLSGFLTFNLSEDLKKLDKLIIKEYTKNTFYGDLNKWLMNSKLNFYEPVAYFTARLMYSLNSYAKNNNLYCSENKKELHRGVKLSYSCLLPYERAKGKIILLSAFTSTSESNTLAERWAGRGNTKSLYKTILKFSVVFRIKNVCKAKWISNGINVQKESAYKNEKEILYQPFSFYFVRDVQIDIKNYMADIYLETIGKEEILEEKIKIGKEIQYNDKEKKMVIKN